MRLDLGEWVMRFVILGVGLVIFPLKILFWYRLLSGDFGPGPSSVRPARGIAKRSTRTEAH